MNRTFIRRLLYHSIRGALVGVILGAIIAYLATVGMYLGGFLVLKVIDSVARDLGIGEGYYFSFPMIGCGFVGLLVGLVSTLFSRRPMPARNGEAA